MPALEQLEAAFLDAQQDDGVPAPSWTTCSPNYAGRPTPLTRCRNLGAGQARIYLKREDLLHGGAHKTNQVLGQALLAKRMGKTPADRRDRRRPARRRDRARRRAVRARDAHLHGRRRRRAAAAQRLPDAADGRRGGAGRPAAARTLKDAVNEALRDWTASFADTHYLLGTVAGPHPFPLMVREFQRVIGKEARAQILEVEGRLPDAVIACVGGGSNAIGIFADFIDDEASR